MQPSSKLSMEETSQLHTIVGTGPLGHAVMRRLLAQGQPIRMINRSGDAGVPEPVEVVKADISDVGTACDVLEGAHVVYLCANAPYTDWPEQWPPLMHGVIEGCISAGARLVFGDNLYMYGPSQEPLTEAKSYSATGPKGITRAEIARTLMEAYHSGKLQATICRASDFFGPRVTGSVLGERVFGNVLAGKPPQVLGNPDVPHTYTYIDDFARALVTLGERDEALGEVWHAPSAETITTRAFLTMVCEEADVEPRIQAAGRFTIGLMGRFNKTMRELKELWYSFDQPFVVDHGKYERAFGAETTPHREAIRATLDWYRQRGASS